MCAFHIWVWVNMYSNYKRVNAFQDKIEGSRKRASNSFFFFCCSWHTSWEAQLTTRLDTERRWTRRTSRSFVHNPTYTLVFLFLNFSLHTIVRTCPTYQPLKAHKRCNWKQHQNCDLCRAVQNSQKMPCHANTWDHQKKKPQVYNRQVWKTPTTKE